MPPYETAKFRSLGHPSKIHLGTFSYWNGTNYGPPSPLSNIAYSRGSQLTYSTGHRGPPYLEGSDFRTEKSWAFHSPCFSAAIQSDHNLGMPIYNGPSVVVSTVMPLDVIPTAPTDIVDDSASYGPIGWNKFRPGRPGVRLGQDVLEIGDIPRAIRSLRDRTLSLHSLSSKFLAWEFGLRPILADLRYILHLQTSLHSRITQLIRDNGKPVRRKGIITTKVSNGVESTSSAYLYPGKSFDQATTHLSNFSALDTGVSTYASYSFAARFRYWVPDIGSQRWSNSAIASLLDMKPTPSLLYQVIPWSWLIDWFSNVGDVLDNLSYSSAENLVADYAYVMGSFSYERSITARRDYSDGSSESASIHIGGTLKVRHQANPFGFGFTIDSLNARQWAILAALGFLKSGKFLK